MVSEIDVRPAVIIDAEADVVSVYYTSDSTMIAANSTKTYNLTTASALPTKHPGYTLVRCFGIRYRKYSSRDEEANYSNIIFECNTQSDYGDYASGVTKIVARNIGSTPIKRSYDSAHSRYYEHMRCKCIYIRSDLLS